MDKWSHSSILYLSIAKLLNAALLFWEWISNFISLYWMLLLIILILKLIHVIKRGPWLWILIDVFHSSYNIWLKTEQSMIIWLWIIIYMPYLRLVTAISISRTQFHSWRKLNTINLLALCGGGSNFKSIMFKLIICNSSLSLCCEIALRWIPQNLTNERSRFVPVMALPEKILIVMAWWCLVTSHCLSQCWLGSMSLGHNDSIVLPTAS